MNSYDDIDVMHLDPVEAGRDDGAKAAEGVVRFGFPVDAPKEHVVGGAYVRGWWAGYLSRSAEISRRRKAAEAGVSRDPAMRGSGLA